jgi:hypothetical protein
MHQGDGRLPDDRRGREIVEPPSELTEADLEWVVGGLARPWTETDTDEWLEPTPNLL